MVLWALVGLGPVLGATALLSSPAAVGPREAPDQDRPPTMVLATAELAVEGYLEGDAEAGLLASNVVEDAGRDEAPSFRADRLTALTARSVGTRHWEVNVAAQVRELVNESYEPVGTWYFEVGVVDTPEGMAVGSPPARVAAPRFADAPRLVGSSLAVPRPDDPVVVALEQFFWAMLGGEGDVSRYLAPDAAIDAVGPAAFAQVSLDRTSIRGDGADRVVVAELTGTTLVGNDLILMYEVELRLRDSRWEVRSISGAPEIAADVADSSLPPTSPSTVPPSSRSVPADSPEAGADRPSQFVDPLEDDS